MTLGENKLSSITFFFHSERSTSGSPIILDAVFPLIPHDRTKRDFLFRYFQTSSRLISDGVSFTVVSTCGTIGGFIGFTLLTMVSILVFISTIFFSSNWLILLFHSCMNLSLCGDLNLFIIFSPSKAVLQ